MVLSADGHYQTTIRNAFEEIVDKLHSISIPPEKKYANYTIIISFIFTDCSLDIREEMRNSGKGSETITLWLILDEYLKRISDALDVFSSQDIVMHYTVRSCNCKYLDVIGASSITILDSDVLYLRLEDIAEVNLENSRVYCETLLPLDDSENPRPIVNTNRGVYCHIGVELDTIFRGSLQPFTRKYTGENFSKIASDLIRQDEGTLKF